MKKILKFSSYIISICFIASLFSACGLFDSGDDSEADYEVTNQYFKLVDFEPHVLTSVGVNGHQGSGNSYEIVLTMKCSISLYEYTIHAEFFADNSILDSFDKTVTKNIPANTTFTISKEVSSDVCSKINDVNATFSGKSHEDPRELSGPLKPISYIDLTNKDTAMLIGESLTLDYALSPADTDEQPLIDCGDPSILEIHGDTITAKKLGSTYVSLSVPSDISNNKSRLFNIRVIDKFDFTEFKNLYYSRIESATVSVYCKRYDTNWFGQEKNVSIARGAGIIIKSITNSNYFLTDKSIFDEVSTSYDHEEWYIIDNWNKKYSIVGLQYHRYANIAIGSFISSSIYESVDIFDGHVYQGDYAISYFGNPMNSRISKVGSLNLTASSVKCNVFYHDAGISGRLPGEAIFNPNGEVIGLNVLFMENQCISVSVKEIGELMEGVFNSSRSSSGGPY